MIERIGFEKNRKQKFIIEYIVILLGIWLAFEVITALVEPTLMALCKVRAESIGITISNKVVQEVMDGIGYLDLIILDRDDSGKILALRANVIEMNRIASDITSKIQEKNNVLSPTFIYIPIGNFTGNSLLAGRGPAIKVKIIPTGTVNIDFKTEFISTGINQTRHRIYLEIVNRMWIVAPFTSEKVEVVNHVNVAETVLIGEVPDTFYHLQGLEDFTKEDSLNMIE